MPIDAHCGNPGIAPPHNTSIDVKVNQHAPDIVRHVLHCVKAMHMCLMTAADNDAERDSIDDPSSIDILQVVVVPQLGGHE